jgi:tRNA pseudouridine38-40 synthase
VSAVSSAAPRHGILLTVAYDGTRFSGFAPQNNGVTVAGVLRAAIQQMDPNVGSLRVASRTDAGVHARGQIVSFDTQLQIESRGWLLGLSAFLPPEVAVQRVARVPAGFNPSQEARFKTYHYWILRGTIRDPFLAGKAWRVHDTLDLAAMQREADQLLGTHDFSAFRGAADRRVNAVRTITRAELSELPESPRCVRFAIRGDRFLYNMVRIIVGTLVDVGRRRADPGSFARAFASKERTDLGMTAPPDGLFLDRVELEDWGHSEWPNHL